MPIKSSASKNTAKGIKRTIIYTKASFAKKRCPWSIAHSLIKKAIKNDTKPPGMKYAMRMAVIYNRIPLGYP